MRKQERERRGLLPPALCPQPVPEALPCPVPGGADRSGQGWLATPRRGKLGVGFLKMVKVMVVIR